MANENKGCKSYKLEDFKNDLKKPKFLIETAKNGFKVFKNISVCLFVWVVNLQSTTVPKRPYYYFWAGTIFELIKIVVFEATN